MNITNTIWRNCNAHPDRVAIQYEGRSVSYRTLQESVNLASARLAAMGVTRGNVVALSVNNTLGYLIVLLSLARLGAVSTPLGGSKAKREELVARHHIQWIVLDTDDGWRSSGVPASHYLKTSVLLAPQADGEHPKVPPVAQGLDEQPWLLSLSSGATGLLKTSPQNHARSALLVIMTPQGNRDDQERIFVFTALGIEYGIATVMRQLYLGATTVLANSLKPETFFATVQRDRPTRVVTTTGTASTLVAHAAKALPESSVVCASIRSIVVAGSVVSPALREGITLRISPRLEVLYGSTEVGILAISTPETHAVHPGSAGRLMTWVQAEAVDENDQPLPAGQKGVLRFKSPLLTNGYLGDEEATAQAFRNGWFYPGDTGAVGAAGYLFLGGRIDHLLNIGGNKIDPSLIEKLLDEQTEITESVVVSVTGDAGMPVLVAVVEAKAPFDSEALKRLCLERLGKLYMPQAIIQIDSLPRNESGKVMRSALAASIKISSTDAATMSDATSKLTDG